MRGKRVGRHFCKFRHGITPADAGKTVNPSSRRGMKWDHPRGCGENYRMRNGLSLERGSPPRMRGKRAQSRRNIGVRRITPADAGKTIELLNALNTTGDHPRGCGENFRTATARSTHAGSPPRMRGKHTDAMALNIHDRITPADAGKTLRRCRQSQQHRDHPRGCGENICVFFGVPVGRGSPPRMRGKRPRASPYPTGSRDHPRGCGENPVLHDFRAVSTGSPPRMRGKLPCIVLDASAAGITPADAGKTFSHGG